MTGKQGIRDVAAPFICWQHNLQGWQACSALSLAVA